MAMTAASLAPTPTDRIAVELGDRRYDVVIADGLIDVAGDAIAPFLRRPWVPIVTDRTVARHHLDRLTASLDAAGIGHAVLVLDPGEAAKSWSGLARVSEWLLEQGVERSDHVVALGGGVIGDLVGFAAAILKRGCAFIQIPTTLLAQVDSSVGGKTAINTPVGKNMIGAFHQPALVLIDPTTLDTLPRRELAAGYAEVVNYGLIDRPDFFAWCVANGERLFAGDPAARTHAIVESVRAKAAIVAADERETADLRALLNLGHTFGHALEAATGYSDRLLHGEAVAAGMALAFRFSAARGLCPVADADAVRDHLSSVGLPVDLASAGVTDDGATLVQHMAHDKKASGGTVPFLLAHGIGRTFVDRSVALSDVAAFLDSERAMA